MGLAATVLYVSCIKTGEQKTKVELASAAQTTEVTIRNSGKFRVNIYRSIRASINFRSDISHSQLSLLVS